MITTTQLKEALELKQLNDSESEPKEVTDGYVCDLLSWVMAKGVHGMAWITVQTHLNVVAVASLHEFSCIIIPESIEVPQATLEKATEEDILIYSSSQTAYNLCCSMYNLNIGTQQEK